MKDLILSVLCFHWLATVAVGASLVLDALRRSRQRTTGWAFPPQAVRAFPLSVYERQDAESEPGYSLAA